MGSGLDDGKKLTSSSQWYSVPLSKQHFKREKILSLTKKAWVQNHFGLFIGRFIESEMASITEDCISIKGLSLKKKKRTYIKYKQLTKGHKVDPGGSIPYKSPKTIPTEIQSSAYLIQCSQDIMWLRRNVFWSRLSQPPNVLSGIFRWTSLACTLSLRLWRVSVFQHGKTRAGCNPNKGRESHE